MLFRSSSSPVLGILHSAFSGSPSRDFYTTSTNCTKYPTRRDQITANLPFSHGLHHPSLTSASGFSKHCRRSRSDSNLPALANSPCDIEEFHNSETPKKFPNKHRKSMLRTAPSFSIYNANDEIQEDGGNGRGDQTGDEELVRAVTIGDSIEAIGSSGGEVGLAKKSIWLIEEEGEEGKEVERPVSPPLYLATGLGINGGGDLIPVSFDADSDAEEYYKKMVEKYPCHPLLLLNYARLLQSKGDLFGAEDYYHRATLADPGDGEILLQYAKLVWELHHDQDRALSYFERAAQISPHDSHVLAAYASFRWEIEDDVEEDISQQPIQIEEKENPNECNNLASEDDDELEIPFLELPAALMADCDAAEADKGGNVEGYYKRLVEENPSNPLVLRNYAHFLHKSKGDPEAAEDYYSRAILADPADGETLSHYASLVWELHNDYDKALHYFEQSVQATPRDSHVLAAYASFLWEIEDEEEAGARQDQIQAPVLLDAALTAANA